MPDDRIWPDALRVAALLGLDPHGCGGVVVRSGAGPVREGWLDALRTRLPPGTPWRRMPAGIAEDRLLGGLDLAASLRAGRPVIQTGLLAEADGGVVMVPMAERLSPGTLAHLAQALDSGRIALERDGGSARLPARFGLVLLDEGGEDEAVAEALADRLAFRIDLNGLGLRDIEAVADRPVPRPDPPPHPKVRGAAEPRRGAADGAGAPAADPVATLCAAADDLGVVSLRGPLLALRVARLAAAAAGRAGPGEGDVIEAARLVLAPRATRLPTPPDQSRAEAQDEAAPPPVEPPDTAATAPPPEPPDATDEAAARREADEVVLEAARAAIPKDLLARLLAGGPPLRDGRAGRAGQAKTAARKGRPVGSRPGDPRRGRLDLVATLRAAAPWQRIRERAAGPDRRIVVRPDDLRIKRLRERAETTTIFCVDASGSAALERLAEAKGAVELLLAEAYVRRDRVALIAFRGRSAEVVLPPTRSLVRAKRALQGLPGGGGTPLAAGLDAAASLALAVRRGGGSPVVVVLTDGRANVARSGEGGRAVAGDEALASARALRSLGLAVLVIDTGARPDGARRLAEVAQARYCAMPYADAGALGAAVRAATA